VRALWLRRSGLDPAPAAREGIEALGRALGNARDPAFWALRARLSSLAGDRAQAKESLDRAWAINPLFKAGVESGETEAELSAAGAEPERAKQDEPGPSKPPGASRAAERGRPAPKGAR
jgi:hypothetical protein